MIRFVQAFRSYRLTRAYLELLITLKVARRLGVRRAFWLIKNRGWFV